MRRTVLLGVLMLSLGATAARADLPLRTEDANTEPKGQFRFDFGLGYRDDAKDFGVLDRNWQWDLGRFQLRFGVGDRVDVQFRGTAVLIFEEVPIERPPIPQSGSNYGDWIVATKIRLFDESERRPTFSVLWEIKLPIASDERGGGTNETDFLFYVLATSALTPKDKLHGQLGIGLLGEPRQNSSQSDVFILRLAWERNPSERQRFGAELLSQLGPGDTIDQVSLRGVYEHGIGPWRVYGGLSVGLNDESDDFGVDAGFRRTFRFMEP